MRVSVTRNTAGIAVGGIALQAQVFGGLSGGVETVVYVDKIGVGSRNVTTWLGLQSVNDPGYLGWRLAVPGLRLGVYWGRA